MAYNIIQAHIFYDFVMYLLDKMKRNLENLDNGDFWYSSYMWWLIMGQYIEYFISKGFMLIPLTLVNVLLL